MFGIRKEEGIYYIGKQKVTIADNNIMIDDKKFKGTPCLWELIITKNAVGLNREDFDNYARMMLKTNVLHHDDDPNNPYPRSSNSPKWNRLLKYIWANRREYEGKGLLLFRAILTRC